MKRYRRRNVLVYNEQGKFLEEFETVGEAKEFYDISRRKIVEAINTGMLETKYHRYFFDYSVTQYSKDGSN